MGYILFLLSVLIATFYYFRMARRFDSFDSEITEDLQREMNSLILDFNQTANQNITLIEDRIVEGRQIAQDLAQQISYLKQMRDSLDTEIRELKKSLIIMQDKAPILPQEEKSLAQKKYNQISKDMEKISHLLVGEKNDFVIEHSLESEDKLDIDKETLFLSEEIHVAKKKKTSPILQSKNMAPNIPKNKVGKKSQIKIHKKAITGTKPKILEYYKQGWDIQKISETLLVPKGEVELIIQLFRE